MTWVIFYGSQSHLIGCFWLLHQHVEKWQGLTNDTLSFYKCRFRVGYHKVVRRLKAYLAEKNLNFLHSRAVGIGNFGHKCLCPGVSARTKATGWNAHYVPFSIFFLFFAGIFFKFFFAQRINHEILCQAEVRRQGPTLHILIYYLWGTWIKQLMGGHPILLIYPIRSIGFIVEINCCVCRIRSII